MTTIPCSEQSIYSSVTCWLECVGASPGPTAPLILYSYGLIPCLVSIGYDFKTTFMTESLLGVLMTKDAPQGILLKLTYGKTEKEYPQVVFCMSGRFYVLKEYTYRAGTLQDMPGQSSGSHGLRKASYLILMRQGSI